MFGVKHNECVGFESKWTVVKVSSETSTQTSEFSVDSKGTNTTTVNSTEIQTEETEVTSKKDVDMQKLADWLNKIYPKVRKEINDANNSKAFRGYRLMDDTKDFSCKLIQTVNGDVKAGGGDSSEVISSISWNCNGKTLAVSRTHKHRSWCHHTGSILIYGYKDGKLSDTCTKKITAENCVADVTFHPTFPAILAAGLYTGVINIWNINQEEEEMLITNVNAHDENITQLSWIPDMDSIKNFLLGSASIDGLLKLWNFNLSSSELNIKSKYKIKIPIFGNIKRATAVPEEIARKVWRGIVAFDFSKHVPDMFLVALEGGLVVQCSISGATDIKGSTKEEPLLDPVLKYYEPHEGEIISMCFSPNRKEMFMTIGTDSDIRIYLIDQEDPAQVIYTKDPLNSIMWIPYEEKLIAGCGPNGLLEIFQIQKAKLIENVNMDKVSKNILTKIALNNDNPNIVVMGSINGDIQLWNVPWNLISFNNQ